MKIEMEVWYLKWAWVNFEETEETYVTIIYAKLFKSCKAAGEEHTKADGVNELHS